MQYDMPLFRPPSEAESLIFQVTLGCSWNKCLFCSMYSTKKYQVRPWEDVKRDILEVASYNPRPKRIFLADGDALSMDTYELERILRLLNNKFPTIEGISSYVGPQNLLEKSTDELKLLRDLKLDLLYLGVESGNDVVLEKVKKGADRADFAEGCKKAKDAGMDIASIILLGLGGALGSYHHAKDSASLINTIDPHGLGCLTLMMAEKTKWYENRMGDGFRMLDKMESIRELRWFVEDLDLTNCRFNTTHATNYLPLNGMLPSDKDKIIEVLDSVLEENHVEILRPEWIRQQAR